MKIKFISGIRHAINGIIHAFSKEQNLRIQALIGFVVILIAIILHVPKLHLLILITVAFLVVILEMINTAVEHLINKLSPNHDPDYGRIKDVVAGIALLGAILSVIVGFLILLYPLIELFNRIF